MPNLLSRLWSSIVARATEGEPRPGPWHLPVSGGWLTPDAPSYGNWWNWWQLGGSIVGHDLHRSAMVEACISAYAQTVSMCPGDHWRMRDPREGRERVTTSSLSRLLRHPNEYQSISDFLLNATRSLYLDGNAYALALRNDRFEIDQLHLMNPRESRPQVATSTGDVFYTLGGNNVIDSRFARLYGSQPGSAQQLMVPQRDVLHIRLHCLDRTAWPFPLVGDTPLTAALGDLEALGAIKEQQKQFFRNQARPSAVLSTDLILDKDQVQMLRDRWNEQAKGLHQGGTPILTGGLKVQPWGTAAKDAQLAEMLKLTDEHIALVFRIPLAILGLQPASGFSIEQLMGFWLASGLGFCLNHIEEAFDRLFQLKGQPDEYTEFDTEALLRSARKDRIDALVRAVQGGIYAPNEARAKEDMPAVAFGDEPRVQQQVVPLSAAGAISGGTTVNAPTSPTVPAAPSAPAAPAATGTPLRQHDVDVTKSVSKHVRRINTEAARYDRRRIA
jgi:HK97 family phage portal protein